LENVETYDELKNLVVYLNQRPKIPEGNYNNLELYLIHIMKSCWDKDLNQRPSFEIILKSMNSKLLQLE
jgi:hypothetical protein